MSNAGGFRGSSRVGLSKIRPLTATTRTPHVKIQESELPNGNYLNESKAKQLWADIESVKGRDFTVNEADELKRTLTVSELQDTSGKIQSLISKFDDIDQETLMHMMQVYERENGVEAFDETMILTESKTSVLDLISQMKDLTDSEKVLIETLKGWFAQLDNKSDLKIDLTEVPNVDDVIHDLERVVSEVTDKSEKVALLHNDISDFMFKQIGALKRVIASKNENIAKLKATIDEQNAAAERRKIKKKQEADAKKEAARLKEQFEAQIKQNQEMKTQIDQLKKSLQESELKRVAAQTQQQQQPSRSNSRELLELNNNINNMKLVTEEMENMYNKKMDELKAQISERDDKIKDDETKYNILLEKVKRKDQEIFDLNANLQKQLKILAIESHRTQTVPEFRGVSQKQFDEEKALMQLQQQQEIKKLQQEFSDEIRRQLDSQRERYMEERRQLLATMTTGDQQKLLTSIQAEYEKRIETLQQENEENKEKLMKNMASKISLLTRQYEHRIKGINENHQDEMNIAIESLKHDRQILELDFEEKFNLEVRKIEQDAGEKIEKLQKRVTMLETAHKQDSETITAINNHIEEYCAKTGVDKNVFGITEKAADLEKPEISIQRSTGSNLEFSKYTEKLRVAREEMENQNAWELDKQRKYYEREMVKLAANVQQDVRDKLIDLQDMINQQGNKESAEKVARMIESTTNFFEHMNEKLLKIDDVDETPMVSITEVKEKTKSLTDKIIELRQNIAELKLQQGSGEKTIDDMKAELEMFRSMANGDQEKLKKLIDEMNEKHLAELQERDKMIKDLSELSNIKKVPQSLSFNSQKVFANAVINAVDVGTATDYRKFDYSKDEVLLHVENVVVKDDDGKEKEVPIPPGILPTKEVPKRQIELSLQNKVQYLNIINEHASQYQKLDNFVIKNAPEPITYTHTPSRKRSRTVKIKSEPVIKIPKHKSESPPPMETIKEEKPVKKVEKQPKPIEEPSKVEEKKEEEPPKIEEPPKDEEKEPVKVEEKVEEEPKKAEEEEKTEESPEHEEEEQKHEEEEEILVEEDEYEIIDYYDTETQTAPLIFSHVPRLMISDAMSQEEQEQLANLSIPSGPDSFHVSARQEELRIVMTFVGEKYLAKGFTFENAEIFSNVHHIDLRESLPVHHCRLEPIVSYVEKDHENGKHINMQLVHMEIATKDIGFARRQLEMEMISFEVQLGHHYNPKFLDSIKVTAFDREKVINKKLKQDLDNAQRQLAEKPSMILLKDHTLDDLAKPKFSVLNPRPLRSYTNENLGIPTLSQDLLDGKSYLTLTPDKSTPQLVEEESEYEESPLLENEEEEGETAKSSRKTTSRKRRSAYDHIQNVNLPDVDINEDPFGASIKLLQTQIRELKMYGDDDNDVVEKIGNDTNAYYAYITAAGYTDDAHFSFMESIKSAKNEHDDLHTNLIRVIGLGQSLIKCVSLMRQRYDRAMADLNSVKVQAVKSEVKFQAEIINAIQQQQDDPNASDKMNQMNHLHKLENSLSIVDSLKLVKTEEESTKYEVLMATISQSIKQVKNDELMTKPALDKLTNDVQIFISGLNKDETGQIREHESSSEAKRLRIQRDDLRKSLKNVKLENETLQQKINQLQQRVDELKEQKDAEQSLSQAQLANLREAMAAGEGSTPEQAKDQFKKHMLNMVSLLDAVNAEKSMLTNKVSDLEDELARAHEREKKLQIQISDLIDDNDDFKRSNTSSIMFKDADIEHLKEQLNADQIVNDNQRKQLEEATANHAVLLQANAKLEDELFNARSEIRQLKMQIEELNIQLAMRAKQNPLPQQNTSNRSSSKDIKAKIIQETKPVSIPIPEQPSRKSNVKPEKEQIKPIVEEPVKAPVQDVPSPKPVEEPAKEEEEKVEEKPPEPEQQPIDLSDTKTNTTDEEDSSKQNTSAFASKDYLFRDSSIYEEIYDGYDDNPVLINIQKDNFSTLGDNAPHLVHNPLNFLNKKKKINLNERPQTQTSKRMQVKRHTTTTVASIPSTQDLDLTINNAVQGKRQVTGVSQQIRPTTKISDTTAAVVASATRPEGELPVVTSNLKFPQVSVEPPKQNNRPQTAIGQFSSRSQQVHRPIPPLPGIVIDKTLEQNPPEPIRITLMVNQSQDNQMKAIKRPLVIPPLPQPTQEIQNTTRSENLTLRGMQIAHKIEQRQNTETMRLIERLREQIKKLMAQNESSEKTIMQQRQKITELTLQLHRTKLDVIKANDTTKRTQIRADNIKSRIEICYNEISQRDDEIRKLKRELIILKNSTSPINEASSKILIAKRERERIKRERRQRQEMHDATKEALKAATNEATYKHLTNLLQNTESSMARLEANKRMWKEIERKQVMLVLEAMSRLSTSEVDRVKAMLPELSPFRSMKHDIKFTEIVRTPPEEPLKPTKQTDSIGPTYADKVMVMDKLDPPLTTEERRDVILRRESPELEKRLVDKLKSMQENNRIRSTELIQTA